MLAATGPTSDGLILAPGASVDATLNLTNLGAAAVTVDWTATAPSGVSLGTSSGSLTVPLVGQRRGQGAGDGGRRRRATYNVAFALTDHATGAALSGATLRVAVAQPGALWPYETNEGIYPDGTHFTGGLRRRRLGVLAERADRRRRHQRRPRSPRTASRYTWPTVGRRHSPTTWRSAGQTIPQPAGTKGAFLGLLGSATNAPTDGSGVPGDLTVTYTDGTTAKATVTFSDWTLNGGVAKPLAGQHRRPSPPTTATPATAAGTP